MAKVNKSTKSKSKPRGSARKEAGGTPVCIAALFCDSAFTNEDQTVTIVRTIDTITFPPGTEYALGDAIELNSPNRLVILLKRDDATGVHELPVELTGPSGDIDRIGMIRQEFLDAAGPEAGYNYMGRVRFIWRGEGLYWLRLHSKNKIIAKTALKLQIAPQPDKK